MNLGKPSFLYLPDRISGLGDLAHNLWWSWHQDAKMLFKRLSYSAWKLSVHNPVKTIRQLDRDSLNRAAGDTVFLRHYDALMEKFDGYMKGNDSWFSRENMDKGNMVVAYFSAEYGLHHSLPVYAGGLGFLAGDFLKECSDLGVPAVGVGFMYPEGYFRQRMSVDGWQTDERETLDRENAPVLHVQSKEGSPLIVDVPLMDDTVHVAAWKVQVGRVPLYLLDTDIEQNTPENRDISARLYTGDLEHRLRQQIVLGVAGVRLLASLGIGYSVVHLNEDFSAIAIIERIRGKVAQGESYMEAADEVKNTTVFTTHTPVAAGHHVVPFPLMERYLRSYWQTAGIDQESLFRVGTHPSHPEAGFDMTCFALRMSMCRNAVSKKHGEVARRMWQPLWPGIPEERVPITHITNGVHLSTWIEPRMELLFDKYLHLILFQELQ